jgi:predicted secreted Zn-dependent protease
MTACSPVTTDNDAGQFAASTDFAIAWAYNYQTNADGTCSLSGASVGITVSEILPAWQQTAGAVPGITASWQRFITNLQTHESGHTQLDQTAAVNLLSDLQNFPATDCSSIAVAANTKAQADLTALNQANDNYDAATNHGATQGAILR